MSHHHALLNEITFEYANGAKTRLYTYRQIHFI